MNDPKYTPTTAGLRHEDGYTVPLDEPCMIFRGKDIGALSAIVDYVTMLEEQQDAPTIESHLKSSLERLNAFYLYQVNNPELQSVGCSRRSHSQAALFLSMARIKLQEHGYAEGEDESWRKYDRVAYEKRNKKMERNAKKGKI